MTNKVNTIITNKNKRRAFALPGLSVKCNTTALFTGILTTTLGVWGIPANALQVKVNPSQPQLGDTLSVMINLDSPSNGSNTQVKYGGKTYPAFEVDPNQYRALIPTTPLDKHGRKVIQVISNGKERKLAVWVKNRKFRIQRITLPPGKSGLRATAHELKRVREFKALQTPRKYWNGSFLRPNRGRVSTLYGVRRYYNGKFAKKYYHRGVDYASASGSPVIAPAAGRVVLVGRVSQGFRVHGNTVGIDHGHGVTSIFIHLSRINVKEGAIVKAGQLIGGVGSTGASTGPHLHWGLYVNGQAVNPVPWRFDGVK